VNDPPLDQRRWRVFCGWLLDQREANSYTAAVADFIVWSAIVLAALSPIWRRIYIEHFWARGRGTVVGCDYDYHSSEAWSGWARAPIIEYHAAGQRWVLGKGAGKSRYSVGDEVEIFYNPKKPWRFTLKGKGGWWDWVDRLMLSILVFICIIVLAHVVHR
jgi:Protein of unknown function (DUF3592)